MVGVNEDTDRLGHRLLLSQFLGTAGSKVGDTGAQGFHIGHHARETTGGTDAFLLAHVLHRDAVNAIQFFPCTNGHDIVQGGTNPRFRTAGEVVGSLDSQSLQACRIASPDSPHLVNLILLKCLDTLVIRPYHATMIVAFVVLGVVAGHLRQCLRGCNADADRHPCGLPDE